MKPIRAFVQVGENRKAQEGEFVFLTNWETGKDTNHLMEGPTAEEHKVIYRLVDIEIPQGAVQMSYRFWFDEITPMSKMEAIVFHE
jgi:hypothetical protein